MNPKLDEEVETQLTPQTQNEAASSEVPPNSCSAKEDHPALRETDPVSETEKQTEIPFLNDQEPTQELASSPEDLSSKKEIVKTPFRITDLNFSFGITVSSTEGFEHFNFESEIFVKKFEAKIVQFPNGFRFATRYFATSTFLLAPIEQTRDGLPNLKTLVTYDTESKILGTTLPIVSNVIRAHFANRLVIVMHHNIVIGFEFQQDKPPVLYFDGFNFVQSMERHSSKESLFVFLDQGSNQAKVLRIQNRTILKSSIAFSNFAPEIFSICDLGENFVFAQKDFMKIQIFDEKAEPHQLIKAHDRSSFFSFGVKKISHFWSLTEDVFVLFYDPNCVRLLDMSKKKEGIFFSSPCFFDVYLPSSSTSARDCRPVLVCKKHPEGKNTKLERLRMWLYHPDGYAYFMVYRIDKDEFLLHDSARRWMEVKAVDPEVFYFV